MLDVLQVVFPEGAICISVLEQDMRPVGGVGILEEQEGLPADGAASGDTWALGPIELDSSLKLSEAGTLFESLPPSRPIVSRVCVSGLVVGGELRATLSGG